MPFRKNTLSDAYKLVFDGKLPDYYGDEFPCRVYELEPHMKSVIIRGDFDYKKREFPKNIYNLSFPYTQLTINKATLYATISRTSFVSPGYVGLYDLPFNHFLYGYVCLEYEAYREQITCEYDFINQFYSTANRLGSNQFNCIARINKWAEESKCPSKVMYSNSVLWKTDGLKVFSLQEMLTKSYVKPHQTSHFYTKFYPKGQNYSIDAPYERY